MFRKPMLPGRLAPRRTAHAWFDGAPGASGAGGATPPVGGQPPADPPPAGDAGGSGTPPASDTAPKEPPEMARLRRENARITGELEKLQAKEKERSQAELTEAEKLKQQLADRDRELETERAGAKRQRLENAAVHAAARLGFASVDDAMRFLDDDQVEWADDGSPKNVQALLAAVLEKRPYLKASFQQPPDLAQGGRGKPKLTQAELGKMSQAEINARWDEVKEVMKG